MGERRVTWAAVQRLAENLSGRDRAIVADVAKVRMLTSGQVGRLHFGELLGAHRDRTRRRVLERLAAQQLLATLERRIGGFRAGSAGLVFALGPAGLRLMALEADYDSGTRARQPGVPTERFLAHNLAVAELYVALSEAEQANDLKLALFHAEPGCWWRDGEGEWVKPDAYAVVSQGDTEDHWAIEIDQATESLPTLRRKLAMYLKLVSEGESGPNDGPLPRVLVAVPDRRRLEPVHRLIQTLPEPANALFALTTQQDAPQLIARVLRE